MTKKLLTLLLAVGLLAGCQTIDVVIKDAHELRTNVSVKITEIRSGIENVVGEAKSAYETLLVKKAELEAMIAEINEAVEAVNQLLGKDEASAEEMTDLRATIDELKNALEEADIAVGEIETAKIELAASEETSELTSETVE